MSDNREQSKVRQGQAKELVAQIDWVAEIRFWAKERRPSKAEAFGWQADLMDSFASFMQQEATR